MSVENITDATVLKQENAVLNNDLSKLINKIPGGIMTFDIYEDKIKLVYFNDYLPKIFGFTRSEYVRLTKNDPFAIVHQDDIKSLKEAIDLVVTNKKKFHYYRYRHLTKDGSYHLVSLTGNIIKKYPDHIRTSAILIDLDSLTE